MWHHSFLRIPAARRGSRLRNAWLCFIALCVAGCSASAQNVAGGANAQDPLPSWNESASKKAIIDLVTNVTRQGSADFVPVPERIATFDNDGTLWGEMPMYVQGVFAFDRVKALAPQHPEWKQTQPFKGVLEGDMSAVFAAGEKGIVEIIAATHTGMTAAEFETIAREWIATARHPTTKRLYTEMVYQPMLEVLTYLRANGFKTFIVSGGGVEFMRPWTERVYGVPPEQVIGSRIKIKYEHRAGPPVLLRLPEVDFIDDHAGKPVGIHQHIGRRPVAAFGNSDGDFEMLEWTTSAPGRRLGLIVHHTDAKREYAYGPDSRIGTLKLGLADAPAHGWLVMDMAHDWTVIYPPLR